MNTTNLNDIVVKESDYQKLLSLIESSDTPAAEKLENELSRAEIVDDHAYPEDAVSMGSRVRYVDLTTQKEGELTLVFPRDTDVETMKISVLTPMGSALIGLRIGGVIDWELPNRRTAKIKVLSVNQEDPKAAPGSEQHDGSRSA